MPKFEGCVEAREISLTRKGANQHAHVLVRKNLAGTAETPPLENPTMATDAEKTAAEVQKAARDLTNRLFAMADVTRSYYLALDEAAQTAFLAKSAEDQAKEAETAKKAKEEAEAKKKAEAEGKTAAEAALEKKLGDQDQKIADLEKQLKDGATERELEKRAAHADFVGYPGGQPAVVDMLKSFAGLPDAARAKAEDLMKSQAKMARAGTIPLAERTEGDLTKRERAEQRIEKAVAERVAKGEKRADAFKAVVESKEFAEDVAEVG